MLTDRDPVPWFCRSVALSITCKVVGFPKVVGRAEPFHKTTEFDSNPVPLIAIVAALPGGTYRGEIALIDGTGLFTLNVTAAEGPPPGAGFCTVIALAELAVEFAAGTVAFNSVALTNVVARAVPFQVMTEDEIKPEPATSNNVSPAPASTLEG